MNKLLSIAVSFLSLSLLGLYKGNARVEISASFSFFVQPQFAFSTRELFSVAVSHVIKDKGSGVENATVCNSLINTHARRFYR